jgi:hypothetical protein
LLLLVSEDDVEACLTNEEDLYVASVIGAMRAAVRNGTCSELRVKDPAVWERTPFPRGPKPPRRRTKWTDVETGKQVHIYKDTGRRWAHQPPHNEESNEEN